MLFCKYAKGLADFQSTQSHRTWLPFFKTANVNVYQFSGKTQHGYKHYDITNLPHRHRVAAINNIVL